jgi:hypothetical protein
MRKRLVAVVLAGLGVFSSSTVAQDAAIPRGIFLPKHTITAAPADVDGPAKTLPGLYVGTWNNVQDHVLIVEDVRKVNDKIMFSGRYVWGAAPSWNVPNGGDALVHGEVVGNKLTFTRVLRNQTDTYTYTANSDGRLSGQVNVRFNDGRTGSSSAALRRAAPAS